MSYHPEAFFLVIDDEHFSYFEVREIHGDLEGYFLVKDGVPIGRLVKTNGYQAMYGLSLKDRSVVELLPMLDDSTVAEGANVLDFLKSLLYFLRLNDGWAVVCERFFDENSFEEISSDWNSIESFLSHVALYWKGVLVTCPSFIVRQKM